MVHPKPETGVHPVVGPLMTNPVPWLASYHCTAVAPVPLSVRLPPITVLPLVVSSVTSAGTVPLSSVVFVTTLFDKPAVSVRPESPGVVDVANDTKSVAVPENAVPLILAQVVATVPALVVQSPVNAGICAADTDPLNSEKL